MINENKNGLQRSQPSTNAKLLTRQQVADFLGISAGTLAVWSCTKRYPLKFVKVGRLLRYREKDLADFLDGASRDGQSPLL